MKEGSPYISKKKDEVLEPDWKYVHDLELLRVTLRQDEQTGKHDPSGSLINERHLDLKKKYPEAVSAFRAELREEKEWERSYKEAKRQESLERHKQSAYLKEKMDQLSESEDGERQLQELIGLRDLMICWKMGQGSEAMGYIRVSLRNKYPEAYEAFQEELRR